MTVNWPFICGDLAMLFCTCVVAFADDSSLSLVQVLYRHGDRSATRTYPRDERGEEIWPQGFGQLSQVGMLQHYSLGQFLRLKYVNESHLLNPNYTRVQITVRSTDFDRTLMSAESDLAGLFPPWGEEQQWGPGEGVGNLWQPIPVHTRPPEEDQLLAIAREHCPKYTRLWNELMDTHPYSKMEEKYKDLIQFLADKSGYNATLPDVAQLTDIFFCQKMHQIAWPAWMNESTFTVLEAFQNLTIQVSHSKPELRKLQGGPIVAEMLHHMQEKIDNSSTPVKMYMYSAHDTTVSALLGALNVYVGSNPPYISCVIVELHRNSQDGSYAVQVMFRNETNKSPYILKIQGCDDIMCEFSQFVEATKDMVVEDLKAECGVNTSSHPSATSVVLTVAAVVLIVAILLALTCCYLRKKRKDRYRSYLITDQDEENQ